MNCSDFERRMQHLIDNHRPLSDDHSLQAHAQRCDACYGRMQLWQQIESVLDETPKGSGGRASPPRQQHHLAAWSLIAAVAAVLLVAFLVSQPDDQLAAVKTSRALEQVNDVDSLAAVDPALWWRNVQDQDWLGRTMPAVQSVRDGVAPLGRSLLQAVAILTTSRGESTS